MQTHLFVSRRVLAAFAAIAGSSAAVQGAIVQYSATLNGANESPANGSAGVGSSLITYDSVAHTLSLQIDFSGLTGLTTASHIHGATTNPFTGTAGVMTTTPSFAGFPNGVNAGSLTNTLNLTLASSWNPSFVTARGSIAAAETYFANSLADGKAYLNIHTSFVPGGEIRGFYRPIPTPASLAVLATGGLVATRRRRAR